MKLIDLAGSQRAVAIASRLDSQKAIAISKELVTFLQERKIKVYAEARIASILGCLGRALYEMTEDQVPVVLCIGGDGTILRVAQKLPFKNMPAILGINVGAVGFMAEFDIPSKDSFPQLVSANLIEEKCMRLSCHVDTQGQNHLPLALNEVLIITSRPSKALSITIRVDGQVYSSGYVDGVIVSTPTGSTAYAMSAGGAIVAPTIDAIQVVPVCPFARSGLKPLIVNPESAVEIELLRPKLNAIIAIDGQFETPVVASAATRISIKRSGSIVKFLRTQAGEASFFSRLNRKLLPGAKFPLPKHDQPEE
jgi:NAD+ kinase